MKKQNKDESKKDLLDRKTEEDEQETPFTLSDDPLEKLIKKANRILFLRKKNRL